MNKKKKKKEEDDDKILCALVFNSKVNNIIKLRLSQFAIKKKISIIKFDIISNACVDRGKKMKCNKAFFKRSITKSYE